MAEGRIRRLPTEEHMILVEGTLQNPADSTPVEADGELTSDKSDTEPFMRHRLRDRLAFGGEIGACC